MGSKHCGGDEAAQQPEWIEQLEQSASLVERPQFGVDAEGNALQQVAESHPDYHARHQPAGEQGIISEGRTTLVGTLAAEFEPDWPNDKRRKNKKHSKAEARKRWG